MKNILDKVLQRAGQLDALVDGFVNRKLRGDRVLTPAEILAGITKQIEAGITVGPNGPMFPYNRVRIALEAENEERRTELQAALPADYVGARVIEQLRRHAEVPAELRVETRFVVGAGGPARYDIAFRNVASRKTDEHPPAARAARLVAADGSMRFPLGEGTINVGRVANVHDRSGRLVRRNQVALDGSADSQTVSRAHARIHAVRENETLTFVLFDEGSRHGSTVVRAGRAHKVLHGTVGFRLKDGDEVHFGKVQLRFRASAGRD